MLALWEYFWPAVQPDVFNETPPFDSIFKFPITELLDVVQNSAIYPYNIRFLTAAHCVRVLQGIDIPPTSWYDRPYYISAMTKEIPLRKDSGFISIMTAAGGAQYL